MAHYQLLFNPVLGLSSGYLQTVLGSYGFPIQDPPSSPLIVPVSDNDQLLCLDSTPEEWSAEVPTIILAHGLGGSSNSRYLVRIARYLFDKGHRVIRVNFRGAGPGELMARQPSHAGRSGDLFEVCKQVQKQNPRSHLKVVGFSLSGNILLKMLGELGTGANSLVNAAFAVCPAIDLKKTVAFMRQPKHRLFENYYLDALIKKVMRKKVIYHDYSNVHFPDPLNLYTFDEVYTAPLSGFKNADEYYELCSCKHVIPRITVPTKILFTLDDPIVPSDTFAEVEYPPCVSLYETKHGGHMGFLSWSGSDFWLRWMDRQVVEWVLEK